MTKHSEEYKQVKRRLEMARWELREMVKDLPTLERPV
jgi:hypothetical protein